MEKLNWPTGLMVIQGNKLESLRALMTQWTERYPLHPLEHEQILVQSNGIAQWLKMALAADQTQGGLGIAAATHIQLPMRFVWQVYRSFDKTIPKVTPFDKQPLTWILYKLLADFSQLEHENSDDRIFEPLKRYLLADDDPRRRYQLALNLADMYDQYQIYRPDWLVDWQNGRDTHCPLEHRWQPVLWRILLQTIRNNNLVTDGINSKWQHKSRADIHQGVMELCRKATVAPAGLPRRVILFGLSSLPRPVIELLHGISRFTQVMLFVNNPSQHYWGDLVDSRHMLMPYKRMTKRKLSKDLSVEQLNLQGNPLLASWGKQGRDYLHLLDEFDQPDTYRETFQSILDTSIDLFESPIEHNESPCLLHQIQNDIFDLHSPLFLPPEMNRKIDVSFDDSLRFFNVHSPQREIEVLHDQLLREFENARANGDALAPRDILVMMPDVDLYVPHIRAVFGRFQGTSDSEQDNRFIPFHIADQTQRGRNTVLIAFEILLDADQLRFGISEVFDLLDIPSVHQRFSISAEHIPRIHQWIKDVNIRWGLDLEHREQAGFRHCGNTNTWLFGIERMLLGYASGNMQAWQGIYPFDEVSGLEAAWLGPVIALIEKLNCLRVELSTNKSAEAWESFVLRLVEDYMSPNTSADEFVIQRLRDITIQWRETLESAGTGDTPIPAIVVKEALLQQLDQPSLTQKFMGGAVNFATLMPMRAIPFKQIYMIGMNDGDYPRHQQALDFDLMAQDYRPGDRSRRDDDRYLFMEALLSARDKLTLSWIGQSVKDNSNKPPSVLVGQLRDYINQRFDPKDLSEKLTTKYPLQAFSKQYFVGKPELFTYAREWREAHDSIQPFTAPMPSLSQDDSPSVEDLGQFLHAPMKTYYQRRFGVSWFEQSSELTDDEVFAVESLDHWSLLNNLIEQAKITISADKNCDVCEVVNRLMSNTQLEGRLPLGAFSDLYSARLSFTLTDLLSRYQKRVILANPSEAILLTASRLFDKKRNPKYHHLLKLWPSHLHAQLSHSRTTRVMGIDYEQDLVLKPVDASQAKSLLQVLESEWHASLKHHSPPAFASKTAIKWLNDEPSARKEYEGDYSFSGESESHPGYQRFYPTYDDLVTMSDFEKLTQALVSPIIEATTLGGES